MRRWISSSCITFFLMVVLFFCFNDSKITSQGYSAPSRVAEVSTVRIVKKHRRKEVPDIKTNKSVRETSEKIQKTARSEPEPEPQSEAEYTDAQEEESESSETTSRFSEREEGYGVGKEIEKNYKTYALSKIAQKKRYPYAARSQGQEGKVRMKLVIEPDGSLYEVLILQKSDFQLLDEASLLAVKKSAPFKKMPQGMKRQEYVFVIDYSLKEN